MVDGFTPPTNCDLLKWSSLDITILLVESSPMACPLRLEFPGALSHVTARGNARQVIVLDDEDRAVFPARLGDVMVCGWNVNCG